MTREEIKDKVIEQIKKDVLFDDYTAISVLLEDTSTDNLIDFLPEEEEQDEQERF